MTSATIGNLTAGNTYYFVVTAYDSSGLESPPSNEASAEMPAVSLAGIVGGAGFNYGAPITFNATASEPGGSITEVDFYDGSTQIGTSSAGVYSLVWNGASVGTHLITVVAHDSNGASSSFQITVSVVPFGITAMRLRGDGSFELSVTGAIGRTNDVLLDRSADWTLFSTVINSTGTLVVDNPGAIGASRKFYKVSSN